MGDGAEGCLGVGDTRKKPRPVMVQYFDNMVVQQVSCGEKFTVVIVDSMDDSSKFQEEQKTNLRKVMLMRDAGASEKIVEKIRSQTADFKSRLNKRLNQKAFILPELVIRSGRSSGRSKPDYNPNTSLMIPEEKHF